MPPKTRKNDPEKLAQEHAPEKARRKEFPEILKDLARATGLAEEVAKSAGGDPAGMNEAVLRLAQEKLFTILVEADPAENPWDTLPKITRAIADLTRASDIQAKMKREIKAKLSAKVDDIEKNPEGPRSMKNTLKRIREEIYGL